MGSDFAVVFRAKDEATANVVRAVLETQGIEAMVAAHETAWLDGVMVPGEGFWGDVLVPAGDVEKAQAVLGEESGSAGDEEETE